MVSFMSKTQPAATFSREDTLSNIIYKTDDEKAANEKFIKEPPTYVLFIKSADVTIYHNKKAAEAAF